MNHTDVFQKELFHCALVQQPPCPSDFSSLGQCSVLGAATPPEMRHSRRVLSDLISLPHFIHKEEHVRGGNKYVLKRGENSEDLAEDGATVELIVGKGNPQSWPSAAGKAPRKQSRGAGTQPVFLI